MIRLALLDDHPAVLSGLRRLLEGANDMEVLAAAADEVALADGLVDKNEPARTLIDAIRGIAAGKTVMPTVSRVEFEAAVARLEDSDLPIFAMLLDGEPVPAIAEGLRTDESEAAHRAQKIVGRLRPRLDRRATPAR